MLAFVIVLQVIVALFLIMVVLLQPGNRGGASAALGGAGSDTVFGARGANTFLSKITFGAAVCFMATNLALSFMSSSRPDLSVLDSLPSAPVKADDKAGGGAAPAAEPAKEEAKDAAPASEAPKAEPVKEAVPERAPEAAPASH